MLPAMAALQTTLHCSLLRALNCILFSAAFIYKIKMFPHISDSWGWPLTSFCRCRKWFGPLFPADVICFQACLSLVFRYSNHCHMAWQCQSIPFYSMRAGSGLEAGILPLRVFQLQYSVKWCHLMSRRLWLDVVWRCCQIASSCLCLI